MLLCDIGNSSLHFYKTKTMQESKIGVDSIDFSLYENKKVYYINVNPKLYKKLYSMKNWINLEKFIDKSKYYKTMGIDRIVACEIFDNALIIDAGSAITVDYIKSSKFEGGFIYPGVRAMQKCYKDISSNLDYEFNFELNLDKMAKNTVDAISYGFIAPLIHEIKNKDVKSIYLTGGDAEILKKFLPDAKVDKYLIFHSMQTIIENNRTRMM